LISLESTTKVLKMVSTTIVEDIYTLTSPQ